MIEVLDRGPGLLPGEEALVFDKFFRGEATRSRLEAGLGLAVATEPGAGYRLREEP